MNKNIKEQFTTTSKEMEIQNIWDLSGNLWTDHNLHDPGITLLELLNYGVSDLAYRAGTDLQDILYRDGGIKEARDFFSPCEIFTHSPVKATDFRKILLDQGFDAEGNRWLRNVWVVPMKSNPKGLYTVLLQFEHPSYNRGIVENETADGEIVSVQVPNWSQVIITPTNRLTNKVFEHSKVLQGNLSEGLKRRGKNSLLQNLKQKIEQVRNYLLQTRHFLNAHRNLCEDFAAFEIAQTLEIGIAAEVEITPEVGDVEAFLADLFFRLDAYISPPIHFYGLEEMLAKGKAVEEIFEGPDLTHGFIDDNELAEDRPALFASEVIRIFMESNRQEAGKRKVLSVQNLYLSSYNEERLVQSGRQDCLPFADLPPVFRPRVSLEKSSIRLSRKGHALSYDLDKVKELYLNLISADSVVLPQENKDIFVLKGKPRDMERYYSIQKFFPQTYGIGEEGLPAHASPLRKAQAKQLKAYLLLFEQLMANNLSQLVRVKDLLSVSFNTNRTYFSQSLEEIPDVAELLGDHYFQAMEELLEDENANQERKSRLLDHLIGRFGESFTNWPIARLFEKDPMDMTAYLARKRAFLQNIPQLTGERGKALNYLEPLHETEIPNLWEANISELERKLRALVSLESYESFFEIYEDFFEIYDELDDDSIDEYRFRLRKTHDHSGKILLSSSTRYYSREDAYDEIHAVVQYGLNYDLYEVKPTRPLPDSDMPVRYYFNLLDDTGEIIARRIEYFKDEETAWNKAKEVCDFIQELTEWEDMYLIEHTLLRHRSEGPNDVWLPDPWYSFSITVLFFYHDDSLRFTNAEFRSYLQELLYRECPAHIYIDQICWVKLPTQQAEANAFKNAYQAWRQELGKLSANPAELNKASNNLRAQMEVLCNT